MNSLNIHTGKRALIWNAKDLFCPYETCFKSELKNSHNVSTF